MTLRVDRDNSDHVESWARRELHLRLEGSWDWQTQTQIHRGSTGNAQNVSVQVFRYQS